MNFANTLKSLRKLKHVTQAQLAKYLQVSRPTVAGYETKNHQPDYEKLEQIARYFEVSIDYLITGETFITTNSEVNIPVDEQSLDHEIMITYRTLSLKSKQEALKFLKLLQIKDQQ